MKYSDIYRLYSTSQPKDAIHQALREVPVDDSDEQYEDRSPLHLACQYGDTEGVKILLERDAEPSMREMPGYREAVPRSRSSGISCPPDIP